MAWGILPWGQSWRIFVGFLWVTFVCSFNSFCEKLYSLLHHYYVIIDKISKIYVTNLWAWYICLRCTEGICRVSIQNVQNDVRPMDYNDCSITQLCHSRHLYQTMNCTSAAQLNIQRAFHSSSYFWDWHEIYTDTPKPCCLITLTH